MSRVHVRGSELHLVVRPGGAPAHDAAALTAVFVHGAMAAHTHYAPQLEAFIGHPRLAATIAWDAFGCGRSEKPDSTEHWNRYAEAEIVADAVHVLQEHALPLGRRLLLIGHSFGTSVALQLAADATLAQHVAGLVLLCPAPSLPASTLLFRLPLFALEWLKPTLSAGFAQRAFHPETPPHVRDAAATDNPMHAAKAFYSQLRWASSGVLSRVRQPALLATGEADKLIPPHMGEAVHAALPGARGFRLIPRAAHMPQLENPAAVNALVEDMLRLLQAEKWESAAGGGRDGAPAGAGSGSGSLPAPPVAAPPAESG